MDDILISSLNQYAYCPKSAWYLFVTGQFLDTADTVEGALLHERSDAGTRTISGGVVQIRAVYLYSLKHRLVGMADLVEETSQGMYPVEYKKGRLGMWTNHHVQLCAQAFCLEEMGRLSRPIPRGFLYYAATGRRQEVIFTRKLRAYTVQVIKAMRTLLDTQKRPDVRYSRKCDRCSCYPMCLPQEVEKLRRIKKEK
jgi:CRISPR-associated exonuclease Cas4